jgi:thymidylate synthase
VASIQEQYRLLLGTLLHNSVEKEDRTGTGTHSVFGRQIRHQMKDGFPLLTTKRMAHKTMMTELKWFLKGDTNIKYLVDNGCNIWNGDAYKRYCDKLETHYNEGGDLATQEEFIRMIKDDSEWARIWGELGPIYGKQWRGWFMYNDKMEPVFKDQIKELIRDLKLNPNSRRHMVNAWNVGDLDEMTLPPCHYGFQCYIADGKLSLMWNQRSVDTFLGLPFNIASYATLLLLLCEETGYEAGELIANLGDVHLYKNHVEQAKEQISREQYPLPQIKLSNVNLLKGEWDYELIDYKYHPSIKAPLSN